MVRTSQPRFHADIRLSIDIGAANQAEAAERIAAVEAFITARLSRTTFTRLPGQPTLVYSDTAAGVSEG